MNNDNKEVEEENFDKMDLCLASFGLDDVPGFAECVSSDNSLQCSPMLTSEDIVNSIRQNDNDV